MVVFACNPQDFQWGAEKTCMIDTEIRQELASRRVFLTLQEKILSAHLTRARRSGTRGGMSRDFGKGVGGIVTRTRARIEELETMLTGETEDQRTMRILGISKITRG